MLRVTPTALVGVVFRCHNCQSLFGSMSDLAAVSALNKVSSVSRPFTSADVNLAAVVTSGTGWIVQAPGTTTIYVKSVASGVATLSANVATSTTATNGSAGVGYDSCWQSQQGDVGSLTQSLAAGVPNGINYAWECEFCFFTNTGNIPLSFIQGACAGKHPQSLTLIEQATLAGTVL